MRRKSSGSNFGIKQVYVTTDKIKYVGDTIIVSGCTNLTLDDKQVVLEILNPEGKVYNTMPIMPKMDGSFATSFPVEGELAVNGTYTARATYAGYTYVPEFSVAVMILATSITAVIAGTRIIKGVRN
jgi:uncharacterized protein YfaS (alpha-2-macroglobulin family)